MAKKIAKVNTKVDTNELFGALSALQEERGLTGEYLIDRIKAAIVGAIKKDYQVEDENVMVVMNPELGVFNANLVREIVEDDLPRHIAEAHILYLHLATAALQLHRLIDVRGFLRLIQQLEHPLGGRQGAEDFVDNSGRAISAFTDAPGAAAAKSRPLISAACRGYAMNQARMGFSASARASF